MRFISSLRGVAEAIQQRGMRRNNAHIAPKALWLDCRFATLLAMTMLMGFSLTACGLKGGLKSPAQVEAMEAKKNGKTPDANAVAVVSPSPPVGGGGEGGNPQQNQASSVLRDPPLPNPPPQGGRE